MPPGRTSLKDDHAKPHAIGIDSGRVSAVIEARRPMDAELDLRLARYFGLSEGFFLRLQDRYAIVEAKRVPNDALDQIVPRAA